MTVLLNKSELLEKPLFEAVEREKKLQERLDKLLHQIGDAVSQFSPAHPHNGVP